MHAALLFLLCWAISFLTLAAALVLLNIYFSAIGNDLELHGACKEAAIAGMASLIEGGSLWLVMCVIPKEFRLAGMRGLLLPVLIVLFLYKAMHFEDWRFGDVLFLLLFQLVLCILCGCIFTGLFGPALILLVVFGILLAVIASFAKDL
jgi:hypothetical protein